MTPLIEVDVGQRLGAFTLDARFTSNGRLTVLFGRSGAGKTSLVDIIGGLVKPERGRVVVDGVTLVDVEAGIFVPKHRRRIGYVFQEARLFPHLTVGQNLAFGSWFAPRAALGPAFGEVIDLLGLHHLTERRPAKLSGGEKQRVAIGRALLSRPRLLLMDEPLSSLDEARKAEILPFIERLRDEAGIPIVYVSHSVSEVLRLATSLVLLEEGRVAAVGPPADILGTHDLAEPGAGRAPRAVLEAIVARHDEEYGLSVLTTAAGEIQVARLEMPVGSPTRLAIAAQDVMLSLTPLAGVSALNTLTCRVGTIEQVGASAADVVLDCGGERIVARITMKSLVALGLVEGQPVHAIIKSVALART